MAHTQTPVPTSPCPSCAGISNTWWRWLDLLIVAGIAAVALVLRYYRIDAVPPGFNSDEAVGAVGALDTLHNGVRLHYAGQGGGGALGFYIAALAFAIFGPSVATIRGTAAFAGVVSVVAAYFLVREMFRDDDITSGAAPAGMTRARLLAALTALGLATSSWHMYSSRVAFAAIGVPFLQAPAAFFLWRGLRTGRRLHFVVTGVLLAAVSFIYMSGAFVPIVFLAFFLIEWAGARLSAHRPLPTRGSLNETPLARSLLTAHCRNLVLCAGLATILLLPMVYFLVSTPEAATQRAQQTLFINPLINRGDPWGTLVRSLWGNLAGFGLSLSWLQGQAPGNLILPVPMTLLFVTGLGVSLWRTLRGRPAYLFAVLSWAVMLVPSILSPDSIPHAARALGAAVGTYTLIAIGTLAVVELAVDRMVGLALRLPGKHGDFTGHGGAVRPLAAVPRAIITFVVLAGLWLGQAPSFLDAYHYYFNVWPQTNDAQAAFHVYAVDLAREMSKDDDPQAVYLLPRDTAAGDVNPNYTVMFLYTGRAGYAWPVDDERTLEDSLNDAVAGRETVHVVRWKTSKHTGADPKEIIRYYLEKHGQYVDTVTHDYFDIETYRLDAIPAYAGTDLRDRPLEPAALDFGGILAVTGFAYGDASGAGPVDAASIPAGSLLWARLRVRLEQAIPADLKVSLTIYDDIAGHSAGQIDKLLINNILHQPTSAWNAGTETDVYFLVPVAAASAPGDYRVTVAVYDAASGHRLTPAMVPHAARGADGPTAAGATRAAALGSLTVRPDLTPPPVAELGLTRQLHAPVATPDGIMLVGYAGPEALRPGEHGAFALLWRAGAQPPADDYRAQLWLGNAAERPLTDLQPLAGAAYSTRQWAAEQVVRGWFDCRLSADMPNGTYPVSVRITDRHERPVADITLGSLSVAGWPRHFEVPAMQFSHPANLGNRLELLGYDLAPPSDTDGTGPEIVLYWRAAAALDISYSTFVHVLDATGQVVAQVDHVPGDGEFPTTGWLPGEIITDRFVVPLPADRIAAAKVIEVGAYDPATLERLPQLDDHGTAVDTRVLLPLAAPSNTAGSASGDQPDQDQAGSP